MKKSLFTLLLGAIVALTFSSCNKYEESMYNEANGQIRYIWYKSNVGNPNETYTYTKKGFDYLLSKIDILDTLDISGKRVEQYLFEYNKDKTLSTVTHNDNGRIETIKFAYLSKYVKYMSYSINDTIRLMVNFYRDNEESQKITRITETYDSTYYAAVSYITRSAFYRRFIGECNVADFSISNSKSLKLRCNKEIQYSGENIVSIKEVYPDLQKVVESYFQYDADVLNPYYGLCYAYNGLLGFSQKSYTYKDVKTYYNGILSDHVVVNYDYYDVNKYKYPREYKYTSNKNNNIPFKNYICYRNEYKN